MADTTNPYLQILEQEEARQRAQAAATLTQALPVKPDAYAAQRRDAMTLGAPVAAVEALPDEMAQRAQQLRVERDIAGSATLQRRFTDADFARLAHDDTPALSNVGKAVAAMTRYAMGADNGGLQQDLRAGVYAASRGAAGVFRGTLETFLAPWLDFTEGRVPGGNPLRRLAEGFGDLAEQAGAEQKRLSPPQEGLIRGGVSSGVQSLAQNALMLPGALLGGPAGAVAALAGMAGFAGGQSYQEGREQGLTPASAAVLGTSQGLIEFATEKIPMSRLLGDLSAASPLYKTLMRQMAAEIPGEQLATVLQDLNEWAALPRNKDKPFSEYLAERPSAAAQTLIATVIGVGGNVAITSAISKVAELQLDQAAQAEQAQRHAALVGELMKAAGGAQLAQRAPASLRDLVQEMAAESDAPGEVFIDARTLVGEDGQGGLLNQDQIAELLPSVAPQLQEAVLTGGDVSVPIGELVGLAGTPLEQGVLEHLRVDPAGISVAEATAASAAATEWLQSAAGKALDAAADRNEAQASAERVQAVIRQQLDAVGRFTSEVHEAYSALVRDFYTTLAGDLGMTAEQAYQAYPLRIGGVNPAAAGLMQPAFHGTHARGIDKFDVSKVGTGEGTQAFGHGLYFAGRRAVAEFYRTTVAKERLRDSPEYRAARAELDQVMSDLDTLGFDTEAEAIRAFREDGPGAHGLTDAEGERLARAIARREAAIAAQTGQTYAVEVPGDDVLLDREARVGDQPEAVRKALESLGYRAEVFAVQGPARAGGPPLWIQFDTIDEARRFITRNNLQGKIERQPSLTTGAQVYDELSRKLGGDAAASEALRKAGVPGLSYFDQFSRQPNTPAAERTRNYVIFSGDDVEITGAFYQSRVKEATPAVTRLLKSLTPAEQAKVTDKVAAKIIELMKDLPSAKETAAVAYAGRAKRGWYAQSADALLQVFGHDAPRFAALLAAMSPQTSVEANLTNALRTWREWTAAGRPKGRDKIVEIMGRSVQGNKGTDSVLGAWINNSVRALEAEDFSKLTLSGPKVNSFFRNLVGVTDEVTNDAWMANFALVDQTMFSGSINADNTDPGKRPGYMAMSALVRQAAAHLTKLTGETWTPAEVQETVWSWAKTLYELSAQAGETRSARDLIEGGALTDDLIASTPDFGSLFHNPAYANILKESGYGDRLEQLAAQRAAAGQPVQEPGAGGQAAPFAPEAQRRFELAAARRLEQLLKARGDARAASRDAPAERQFERDIAELKDEGGYQQSAPGGQPAAGGAVLEPAGVRGGDGALAEPRGPGARADKPLAGLPATVKVGGRDVTFGPHAPARRAAERYMERAGLPYQPPSTYAKVDKARAARIAQAFEEMPHAPNDPRVKAAYDALIRETVAQWQAVKETGLVVEFIDGPDPYGNPRNAILDVTENNHLWVYPTDSGFGEALLNIGLNVNDGTTLTEAEVRAALAAEGATVLSVATHQSNTEPTLVVRVAQPLTPAQGDRLSRALRQEAVAQLANNTGDLFGPQAANWLPFNPDFFLMLDGATAASANAMDPNPLLAVVPGETISGRPVRVNDLFRIVHDYFGHIKEGVGFRAEGEENAWRSHWAMFSPLARAALTTETRGQNSWVNFGPFGVANATADGANTQYAPQKIGLLPDWVVNEGATDELQQSSVAPTVGIHFGTAPRTALSGAFYGTGLKGAEGDRVREAADPRIKQRIYFYIDEGKGVRPEAGVGGYAHEVQLPPLYDAKADPLKLWKSSDLNATEARILDAGYAGYFIRDAFNNQGAAVVIGDAARSLPAKPIPNPTTAAPAAAPAPKPYRVALLSREIRALNLDAFKAAAPSAKVDAGTFSVDLGEIDAAREIAASMGVELPAPELAQGPRGSFSPAQLKINLLETADLSTFLHETGHFFLEVMADVAARPDAPARVRDDMARVLEWFGVKGKNRLDAWHALTLDEKRPFHEQFAEAFEHYLFEGKAPSPELQPLFARFRSWMVNVYRSLTDFLAGHDSKLTPTVRGVFDRLLATEEAIKATEAARAYEPIFANAEAAGMTPEEWTAYQALGKSATDRAVGEMSKRSLRDMRLTSNMRSRELRRLQREMAERRKAVEAEVRAEVAETPVEKARAYVKALQQEQAKGDKAHKKATDDWNARYGAAKAKVLEELKADPVFKDETPAERKLEVLRRMLRWEMENPAPAPQVADNEMQIAAELHGFSSADELEVALRTAPPAEVTIEGVTDQRMLERYGDLTTTAGIERAADEAVHNDARARFIATGLRALLAGQREMEPTGKTVKAKGKDGKTTTRPQTVNVLTKAAKDFAEQLVARRKVRELKPGQHVRAESRAGRLAAEAMAAGNTAAAITAQRDQLLNHYAARATEDALSEVEKAVRYLRKLADNTTMPPEYQEQIDVLLDRFDLRDTPLKTIDKRKSLAEWVESQRAIGIEPELPPGLLDEAQRKSYKDMTLEEFRGLVTAAKQIEHLGRLKNKLLTAKDEREFAATVDDLVASIEQHAGDREADTRTPTTNWGRALQAMRNFGAAHIKAATLARILDGGRDGGPMWETFVRTANERGDWETTQRAEATKALADILGPWMKKSKTGGKGVYFPSVKRSFNRESVLAIAMNTGNAGNLQRLLGGEGWTEQQLKPILDTLSREDWQVVQAVWDYFESFRPQIAAKEKRVTGVEPDWIEAAPRTVQFDDGTTLDLRGGYYPIKYDPAASVRAEEHADAEGARRQLQGAYGAATTRRSFTKTRAEEVTGRPLLYTLGGVYSGINDVIHDLAWHEWLIDTNRLLKSEAIDGAIRRHYGPAVVRQFKTWRDAVAEGDGGTQEALDQALGRLRQGVSVAGLGFNLMSALIQPLGLTQSIVRIGPAAVGRGIMQFIANPVKATRQVYEASSFMENRWRTRFRELNELRNKVQGETPVRTALNGSAYWLMMRLQQMVDVPTWLGGYEAAIAAGNGEERARALADQAVIDSQGGGMVKDLSAIERGGPAQKLFTVFYSFMNTALNLGVASKMSENVSRARFAANMLLLYTIPAVLGSALKDALTPGDAGDDDWKATVRKLLGEQLGYLMGLMVVAREFAEAAKVVTGTVDRGRDYAGPAGLRVIADTGQLAKQTAQGEFDDSFRKAFINVMGSLFALPAAQVNRTITGVQALSEGKTKNPAAIFLGYQEPK